MKSGLFSFLFSKLPVKVYGLVGRSGSGKSFRAQSVAKTHHIPLIIDDGLLIRGNRIVVGKSAKQEVSFIGAVKSALFQDPDHQQAVIQALDREKFRKILIIGTSENMVTKIAARLNLPQPKVIIHIEDIATEDEINTAMRTRYTEGKHVIPVAPLQVARNYPSIVYDSIKTGIRRIGGRNRIDVSENTLVRPEFSKLEKTSITEAAVKQMIRHCLYEYENILKVEDVKFTNTDEGYNLDVTLRTPVSMDSQKKLELKEYISDSLERYGGIMINTVTLTVQIWE
ncbi:MAG: hypothetical protein K5634_04570 [Sphaerochaetaceae bacterium]|nr:hypothetical protein [Sphaerochaetaceae bacterium]